MQDLVGVKLEKIRRKAKDDLYYFSKHVLGYDLMEPDPHRPFCDFITDGKHDKKLILMPRGSFKSTIMTVAYSLWRLVNNPNIRILIVSETFGQSKGFLRSIKQHIEENETFKMLFGVLRPDGRDKLWSSDQIIVDSRTNPKVKEPTISCAGVGVQKTGYHCDLIIMDDVQSDKNTTTMEQIEKVKDFYKNLMSILDPGGKLFVVGTRWHFSDLYNYLLEEESDQFGTYIKKAIQEDGSLLFPTRLTHDFLEKVKKAQGAAFFSAQYQNNPVDQETAMFKRAWLQFYQTPPPSLRHFIVIDPASGLSHHADFTGVVVAGICPDGDIYIREAVPLKATIADVMARIFELVEKYDIHNNGCLGLEVNAMQRTWKYVFNEEMSKKHFFFAIKELRGGSNKSKPQRVSALQPYFENGKIWLKKEQTELIDQICRFPKIAHDDLIDAMAYVLEIMIPAEELVTDKWEGCTLPENHRKLWEYKDSLAKRRVTFKRWRRM